jgi:hypothetical protein
VAPVATPAPAVASAAPAAPKTAIQIIEAQIVGLVKQREQAIANVHAVEGALQGAQQLIAALKEEAAKAEALAKTLLAKAETDVKAVESGAAVDVEKLKAYGIKVLDAVEAEAKKL